MVIDIAGHRICALISHSMGMALRRLDAAIGISECNRELLPELKARAQEAHLDVRLAKFEHVSGLPDGEAFHITEQKDETMLLVQLLQGGIEQPIDFLP